jgi:hypothetical protein
MTEYGWSVDFQDFNHKGVELRNIVAPATILRLM